MRLLRRRMAPAVRIPSHQIEINRIITSLVWLRAMQYYKVGSGKKYKTWVRSEHCCTLFFLLTSRNSWVVINFSPSEHVSIICWAEKQRHCESRYYNINDLIHQATVNISQKDDGNNMIRKTSNICSSTWKINILKYELTTIKQLQNRVWSYIFKLIIQ